MGFPRARGLASSSPFASASDVGPSAVSPFERERVPNVLFGVIDEPGRGLPGRLRIPSADRFEHGAVLRNRFLLAERRGERQSQIDFQCLHDDATERLHERVFHRAHDDPVKAKVRLKEAIGVVACRNHVTMAGFERGKVGRAHPFGREGGDRRLDRAPQTEELAHEAVGRLDGAEPDRARPN